MTASAGRGCSGRAAYATINAEAISAIPSASAVGGMAARSAGVRLMGAGSHTVSNTSATPNVAAMRA